MVFLGTSSSSFLFVASMPRRKHRNIARLSPLFFSPVVGSLFLLALLHDDQNGFPKADSSTSKQSLLLRQPFSSGFRSTRAIDPLLKPLMNDGQEFIPFQLGLPPPLRFDGRPPLHSRVFA